MGILGWCGYIRPFDKLRDRTGGGVGSGTVWEGVGSGTVWEGGGKRKKRGC